MVCLVEMRVVSIIKKSSRKAFGTRKVRKDTKSAKGDRAAVFFVYFVWFVVRRKSTVRAAHPTRLVARTAQISICAWIESNLLKQVPPCG